MNQLLTKNYFLSLSLIKKKVKTNIYDFAKIYWDDMICIGECLEIGNVFSKRIR